MPLDRLRFLYAGLLLGAASSMHAQKPLSFTAARVVFAGGERFQQSDLEGLAGLHAGSHFNKADLAAAAQRLSDSGYFDSVAAALDGPVGAVRVDFTLKPASYANYLPCGFTNLVWLTPAEETAAIKGRIPLYFGSLPEAGTNADDAAAALTAALAAKGVQAKVEHDSAEPTLQHPQRVLQFSVQTPAVLVGEVHLKGVAPEFAGELQTAVDHLAHTRYDAGPNGRVTTEAILAPLHDNGYIHARLQDLLVTPGPPTAAGVPVSLAATLDAGAQYHLGSVNFAGTPVYTNAQFEKALKLHPGDVASDAKLRDSLRPLDEAYQRLGYLDVIVHRGETADESTKTVSYQITVEPGEPYTIHEVKVEGLSPAALAEFNNLAALKAGAVYSPYAVGDLILHTDKIQALRGYAGGFKTYAYPETHTVDVYVTFQSYNAR